MKILAVETSCDETAAAVVERLDGEDEVRVLSSVVASSLKMHVPTGGIVPEVAAREQMQYMMPVIEKAIQESGIRNQELGAIAVTKGPGLIGSLLVGVETAKTLALAWNKPLIPVNHVIAHLYANWVRQQVGQVEHVEQVVQEVPKFPAVAMIISGGHTDLLLMKSHEELEWLSGTRDDAAGECFDKCARILGLPYPGGPQIAAEAAKFEARNSKSEIKLPRPLIHEDTLDFSFSGLKTAVKRQVEQVEHVDQVVQEMAYEIQEAITDSLVAKLALAVERYSPASVLISGGVAANQVLRQKLKGKSEEYGIPLFIPEPKLCTDNAVTIGAWALFHPTPSPLEKVVADPGLAVDDAL